MEASKRITGHMNKDHQLSLIDYLVVYGKLKPSDLITSSVQMTAVDEKGMDLSYDTKTDYNNSTRLIWNELPDDDNIKVTSAKDIKAKLVSMAHYAAGKQGYSATQIKSYPKPNTDSLFMFSIAIIFAIGVYDINFLKQLFKNDPITSNLSPYFPDFVWSIIGFATDRIKSIAITTYVIHLAEVLYLMVPNLIKYRVPFAQSVAWCLLHLVDGYFAVAKFKKLVNSSK